MMRFRRLSNHALTRLMAATAVIVSLGAGQAIAEGDAGDARYDRYVQQERAKEQSRQAAGRHQDSGEQRATIAAEQDGGLFTYSGTRSSPFSFENAEQHYRGR